jgi:hypothetical protein
MARTLAMVTNEAAVRSAMITFATVTLPPLLTTAYNQAAKDGPEYDTINTEAERGLYLACVLYIKQLIAQGAFAGPQLPIR